MLRVAPAFLAGFHLGHAPEGLVLSDGCYSRRQGPCFSEVRRCGLRFARRLGEQLGADDW